MAPKSKRKDDEFSLSAARIDTRPSTERRVVYFLLALLVSSVPLCNSLSFFYLFIPLIQKLDASLLSFILLFIFFFFEKMNVRDPDEQFSSNRSLLCHLRFEFRIFRICICSCYSWKCCHTHVCVSQCSTLPQSKVSLNLGLVWIVGSQIWWVN